MTYRAKELDFFYTTEWHVVGKRPFWFSFDYKLCVDRAEAIRVAALWNRSKS